MSQSAKVKVLDCTFRDGGYYNDWNFSRETVAAYLKAMEMSGVDIIEIGFRFPAQDNQFLGPFAYSTDRFLKTLPLPDSAEIGVMIDAKAVLSADGGPEACLDQLFAEASESPVSLVRIAAHFDAVDSCGAITKKLKSLGYRVGFNIMQVGGKPAEAIEKVAQVVAAWETVDALYFADSFGNMSMDDVAGVYAAFRKHWQGEIGIHAHNNMDRALDNTMKALDLGATWLDSTVLGMGRGAGNTRTEYLLLELCERHGKEYHPESVFGLVLEDFSKMQTEFQWGPSLLYYLSAMYSIHPTYVQVMLSGSKKDPSQIIDALHFMKNSGGAEKFSSENLEKAMYGQEGDGSGSFDATGFLKDREVLIIGSGPNGKEHKAAIVELIKRRKPFVISLNTSAAEFEEQYIDAYAACHYSRFLLDANRYAALEKPLILPLQALPEKVRAKVNTKNVYDYGIRVEKDAFNWTKSGCTVPAPLALSYSLSFASAAGAKAVYMAGMDGYQPHDPRHREVEGALGLYGKEAGALTLTSLTPTTYDHVHRSSVYSPEL